MLMQDRSIQDAHLIHRITNADSAALSELYDRYSRLIFSIAFHILGDSAVAEEVTQDVFVLVWNKAATFDPEQGKVLTWLTSVTRHRAIDHYRRLKVRPEGHSVGWEECCDENSEDGQSVEPDLITHEQRSMLMKSLAILPPDQREALTLAYFHGLTQQEIAAKLDQPLGTIKTRIRLALQKLRSTMDVALYDDR
jgi:RNA polymerase sigma-70 factor (ECF subfamily)